MVRDGPKVLASTLALSSSTPPAPDGNVTVRGKGYRAVSQTFTGFGGARVTVTVLSALSATASSLGGSREVAAVLIVAFLVLALGFSLLASRALQGRLSGFLEAARRLGSGDFSAPIRVEGRDEFAALGMEFNSMSSELSRRLDELSARAHAAQGGDSSHRPHVRLESRSPGAARARAEDRGRRGAGERRSAQRPHERRATARRGGARGVAGRPRGRRAGSGTRRVAERRDRRSPHRRGERRRGRRSARSNRMLAHTV